MPQGTSHIPQLSRVPPARGAGNLGARNLFSGAVSALLCWVGLALAAESEAPTAPDFALRTLTGENLRLTEFAGEVVMINFWASWCGACRSAMPKLNDLDSKYRRAGLVLLSVNIDDEHHRAEHMAQGLKIAFPVLYDADKSVSRLYKADNLPLTVLIDRAGRVRYSHTGYNVGDEHKYLAELRALLNE